MNISTDFSYSHSFPCVVALGCFDGVHLGHASVITAAKRKAEVLGLPLCLWSFTEPPKRFYNPEATPLLTDKKTKEDLVKKLGVDIYISVNFNKKISSLSPEEFFEAIILRSLKASCIVCGFNFTFGKLGKGNIETLKRLCEANGIELISMPAEVVNGLPVSSSKIRECLSLGDLDTATVLLGRPYSVKSKVVDGKHLGRSLGFPTINQKIDKGICLPQSGVYLTRSTFDGLSYYSITNIGTQPTVGGDKIISETHIFDFSGDLYSKEVTVEFLKFIRPVKKFTSLDELTNQISTDVSTAKKLIQQI